MRNRRNARIAHGTLANALLRAQPQEARWLVDSLEIRNDTVLRSALLAISRFTT